ncbi:cupin domain-containing protein [Acidisoma cellulosilytica]|uniref:Cupin domain-containing protein n=1 Tax=Acidisoma cellulosilyticum TaxID=2802395 RepID=A0A963Z5F9_9PROT|nr:cupin domain-containing protein [Acidisoma cellulosilyticum]MCB8882861.1 cupin domain-containing protein [Acidisoma cellulosilyticum]
MSLITKLPAKVEAAWEPVAPEKIVSGQPQTRTQVLYENAAEHLYTGEWEATPGKWRLAYTEWEYIHVISGRCIVTDKDGTVIEAGPGDAFVIEPGFDGTWEVLETMHKHWVIREP